MCQDERLLNDIRQEVGKNSSSLGDLKKQVQYILHIVESNQRALRGANGDLGMLAEVVALRKDLESHKQDTQEVIEMRRQIQALQAVIYGPNSDSERSGIRGDVRTLMAWYKKIDRLTWMVWIAIIMNFVSIAIAALNSGLHLPISP